MLVPGIAFATAARAIEAAPPPGSVLSPDGKQAAWVSDDARSIVSETRMGAHWSDPEQLLTIRGTVGKLVFSLDSKQLAFENPRGDHGCIPVYDIQSSQIGCVDPSFGTDSAPAWTPGGKQISFVRSYPGIPDQPLTEPVPSFGRWTQPPARANDELTIADILQAPISYGPQASGDGRSIAYITRQAYDRAVYYMPVGGSSHKIADYPNDDGQELSQLALSCRHDSASAP